MLSRFLEVDRLRSALTYLFGKDVPGRSIRVFPDDTFIVSYPRSGNTWTRFLIANLLHRDEPVTFANIDRLIPDIHAVPRKVLRTTPRPRVIKSHEYFDLRYPQVIYIVRDPRDVAVSYYHFHRKFRRIDPDYPIESYVTRFIAGEFDSYASWGQNVASWIGTRRCGDGFLLLRYEDLIENPECELAKVASFFQIEVSPEQLSRAVELSSADRMRRLEKAETDVWVVTKNGRKDIPFVREATPGRWKAELPASSVEEIENAWGPIMRTLHYEVGVPSGHFDLFAGAK
jgi:hypothetical protein